jgi:hypothetical protein
MVDRETYGGLFVALGVGLLAVGFLWRAYLQVPTVWPPLLFPGTASLAFGCFNLWRSSRQMAARRAPERPPPKT